MRVRGPQTYERFICHSDLSRSARIWLDNLGGQIMKKIFIYALCFAIVFPFHLHAQGLVELVAPFQPYTINDIWKGTDSLTINVGFHGIDSNGRDVYQNRNVELSKEEAVTEVFRTSSMPGEWGREACAAMTDLGLSCAEIPEYHETEYDFDFGPLDQYDGTCNMRSSGMTLVSESMSLIACIAHADSHLPHEYSSNVNFVYPMELRYNESFHYLQFSYSEQSTQTGEISDPGAGFQVRYPMWQCQTTACFNDLANFNEQTVAPPQEVDEEELYDDGGLDGPLKDPKTYTDPDTRTPKLLGPILDGMQALKDAYDQWVQDNQPTDGLPPGTSPTPNPGPGTSPGSGGGDINVDVEVEVNVEVEVDICEDNPDILACIDVSSHGFEIGGLPEHDHGIELGFVNLPGAANCPSPVSIPVGLGGTQSSIEFSYDTICQFGQMVQPVITALGAFGAVLIAVGATRAKE